MLSTRIPRTLLVAVAVTFATAACGGGGGEGSLSGTVQVDGSSTVFPVSEAMAEEFQLANRGVNVTVGQSGTGGGFKKFCNGETDLSNASRPIKDEEAQVCEDAGVGFVELKVAIDGLSVVVNPENDFVECLTIDELKKTWEPGSTVKTWKDVRSSWPADEIKLYGPGADSGTFDYFTGEVVGEEGASRSDYTQSEDDNVLVQGVAGDTTSLGYFGYAYFAENADKLKVVGVDGGDGCVSPSDDTIEDGSYTPLSRPLYVYVSETALSRPEVAAFAEFYLANVDSILGDIGYVPLPADQLQASMDALEAALA